MGYRPALDFYNFALVIRHEVGDLAGEAATLNSIGLLHYWPGDRVQALVCYSQALLILRHRGDCASNLPRVDPGFAADRYKMSRYRRRPSRPETSVEVEANYTDTHDRSEIGFVLAKLLGSTSTPGSMNWCALPRRNRGTKRLPMKCGHADAHEGDRLGSQDGGLRRFVTVDPANAPYGTRSG